MNEQNLQYLSDNVKYMGFGEGLRPKLEEHLQAGAKEFSISFASEINKKPVSAELHFKQSDKTDKYFFNRYDLKAQSEKKDETLSQTFYINKGVGVTLKEGYNLLNGRAVHKTLENKEGEKYDAWIKLDLKTQDEKGLYKREQYTQGYGYDLKEALSYFPVKELAAKELMERLMDSLQRGNMQSVTLAVHGKDTRFFIEANPQFKTVNLYDSSMKFLGKESKQELMVMPVIPEKVQEKINQKVEDKKQQQIAGMEGQDGKKQVKNPKIKNSEETGLVTKKRTGQKNGMGI